MKMNLLTTVCLLVAAGFTSAHDKAPSAGATLPDLVVMSIKADNLDSGQVSVKIRNQGQRNAGRSDVELSITYGSQPPVSITHAAPPLQPGQTTIVVIDMKQSIVQAGFCATVDPLSRVAESNENNNKRCGKFGGKL
jgi:subtilase family serine protease